MAPTIRSYPQLGFSLAIRTTRRSISSSTGGRPTDLRNFDPSNFFAISSRYQRNRVSGLATAATSARAFRPSLWTISPSVVFSEPESSNRPLIFARRIRFSTARYSFPQQQFLVHGPSDIREHARPDHLPSSLTSVEPGFYALSGFEGKMQCGRSKAVLSRCKTSTSADAD